MNPFDDPTGDFLVLVNAEEQHSLWPAFADVPDGWEIRFGPVQREAAVLYVDQAWSDITPLSVRRRLGAAELA